MKKQNGIMIVMLCVAAFAGCKKKEPAGQPKGPTASGEVTQEAGAGAESTDKNPDGTPGKIGDAAFSLKDLEWVKGNPVKIEPGKIYIVEFWATWCPPCRTSIPHLTDVAHKYKEKNVLAVGISKEDIDVVRPFVDKQGAKMDYNVAVDPTKNVTKGYMTAFGYRGIPHAFIVDDEGKVVWHGHPMADMESVLDKVLAGTFDAMVYAAKKAEEQEKQKASTRAYKAYFNKIRGGGTMEEARGVLDKWIDEASESMLNSLSWQILTEVEENKRDKRLALEAAEKANTIAEGKNAHVLDTYALALFQNGKVKEAIAMQEKSLEMVKGNDRMEADMQKRLAEYKAAMEQ